MMVLDGGRLQAGPFGGATGLALRVARNLAGGGCVLVLEEGDDVERDVPQAGRHGLLTHLDDAWQEPFERVLSVRENGCRVFVARLAYGRRPVAVVAPDEPWLDSRLRLVLGVEAEEASPGD